VKEQLIAKNVNDNFWVVQLNGRKVGNIQVNAQGATLYQGPVMEKFEHLEDIGKKYSVQFVQFPQAASNPDLEVLGYPTRTPAFNAEWDLRLKLPLYTTQAESRSKRCAGYYLVNRHKQGWVKMWCPKLITLQRNEFLGPFQSHEQMQNRARHADAENSTVQQRENPGPRPLR
jgi:hypothetical protein